MTTEFRRAAIPEDLRALVRFDRLVFPSDYFPASLWREYEAWWLIVDGRRVGCCAFERHVNFTGDPVAGSLYIASTAIHPRFQRQGLGRLFKAWQIAYARANGFRRIVTNSRRSNKAMIRLNREFGFRIVRTSRGYYENPREATVVMERAI